MIKNATELKTNIRIRTTWSGETISGTISEGVDDGWHIDFNDANCEEEAEYAKIRIELDEGVRHPYGSDKRHWCVLPTHLLSRGRVVEVVNEC